MEREFVYEALFCDCIHESAYATLSIHKTEAGARKAIAEFIKKERIEDFWHHPECESMVKLCNYDWAKHKGWEVKRTEVLP